VKNKKKRKQSENTSIIFQPLSFDKSRKRLSFSEACKTTSVNFYKEQAITRRKKLKKSLHRQMNISIFADANINIILS